MDVESTLQIALTVTTAEDTNDRFGPIVLQNIFCGYDLRPKKIDLIILDFIPSKKGPEFQASVPMGWFSEIKSITGNRKHFRLGS